jgi:hypothetical protein
MFLRFLTKPALSPFDFAQGKLSRTWPALSEVEWVGMTVLGNARRRVVISTEGEIFDQFKIPHFVSE